LPLVRQLPNEIAENQGRVGAKPDFQQSFYKRLFRQPLLSKIIKVLKEEILLCGPPKLNWYGNETFVIFSIE